MHALFVSTATVSPNKCQLNLILDDLRNIPYDVLVNEAVPQRASATISLVDALHIAPAQRNYQQRNGFRLWGVSTVNERD